MKNLKLRIDDLPEFKGQIVDIFEDYLDENYPDITSFRNKERDEAVKDGEYESIDETAHIWGDDYDFIADNIDAIIKTAAVENDAELTVSTISVANIKNILGTFVYLCNRNNITISADDEMILTNSIRDTFMAWGIPLEEI